MEKIVVAPALVAYIPPCSKAACVIAGSCIGQAAADRSSPGLLGAAGCIAVYSDRRYGRDDAADGLVRRESRTQASADLNRQRGYMLA